LYIPLAIWLGKISRAYEKEADIEAARTMANKQGFSELFNNIKSHVVDPESQFEFKRKLAAWFKSLFYLFRSHPELDERIEYVQNLG
jgi:Zn-dependent protease with chaperone function